MRADRLPVPVTNTDEVHLSDHDSPISADQDGLRLDWNESPLGPSPVAVDRVRAHAHDLHRYPRGLTESVTAAVARDLGVSPERVVLTNGVDEAADLVMARAREVWSVRPGFFGYRDRAEALGVRARAIDLDEAWEPTLAPAELDGAGPIFLDQPHNPTGRYFDPAWVSEVVARAAMTCLDTTYAAFADSLPGELERRPWDAACPPGVDREVLADAMNGDRLVMFHSFSKSHGLAGLRVGALVASSPLAARLRALQRAYTVDTVALHALAGSLDDGAHRRALRRHVLDIRPRYTAALAACPLLSDARSTQANFVLARGRDAAATTALVARLGVRGVWVKDGAPLGLPGWLRVSVGDEAALQTLTAALQAEVRSDPDAPRATDPAGRAR